MLWIDSSFIKTKEGLGVSLVTHRKEGLVSEHAYNAFVVVSFGKSCSIKKQALQRMGNMLNTKHFRSPK